MACGFWTRMGTRCSFGRRGRRVPRDPDGENRRTHNNYLNFAGLRKPPCKFSCRHSLCARLFSARLVRTYFLIPDRYKQAINTTKGAVFLRHCRRSSSVTVMGRTETSIDLLLLFAPISQSYSCVGGRGRPFHNVGSNMTIGITGPRPRGRWRGAVMALIIAAIVV